MKKQSATLERSENLNKEYLFEKDEQYFTLRDSVELFALGICENIVKEEKRTTEILRKCKILDSLTNALNAIKN